MGPDASTQIPTSNFPKGPYSYMVDTHALKEFRYVSLGVYVGTT